jgi:shikimate dehydrogenase
MHTAALHELGLERGWSYEAIEASREQFAELVGALPGRGFAGVNVTIPHKRAALELADEASSRARQIGAANMLSFVEGSIQAENTDAPGLIAALPISVTGRRALVLGAGGAARAVVWALVHEGAEVAIWNRTAPGAERLARELGGTPLHAETTLPADEFDLVVNATSVGLGGSPAGEEPPPRVDRPAGEGARPGTAATASPDLKALRLDADDLNDRQVLVDLAYGPSETDLARIARARGAAVVDGLEVLVRQGAESFRIWTGRDAPLETMRRAARASPNGTTI